MRAITALAIAATALGASVQSKQDAALLVHGLQASSTCITQAEVDAAQAAWGGALQAIGAAFTGSGGSNAMDCAAAKEAALGALGAAYAYHVEGVQMLFNPTLTYDPDTFRDTLDGALSYFVGKCSGPAHIAQDSGFALGAHDGHKTTWMGWENVTFTQMKYALATDESAPNCKLAIAQGKMTTMNVYTKQPVTVDKTFAYIKNSDPTAPVL